MATVSIGVSKDPATGTYSCQVPLAALSGGGVPPEEGDSVQYSVEGKVQSVSGNTATVEIDTVNGEPVGEEGSESPEEEGAEPETGSGAGAGVGAPPTPVAANGPNSPGLGLGPPGLTPKRRANMAGIRAMGAKLRAGAKGRSMPF